jgi:hypothetical protein
MHEAFRRRLEVLEDARALQDAPPQLISVGFINPDKTPVDPTVARGRRDFECRRREGEEEAAFRSRAHCEARAADPRPPVQILISATARKFRMQHNERIIHEPPTIPFPQNLGQGYPRARSKGRRARRTPASNRAGRAEAHGDAGINRRIRRSRRCACGGGR